MSQNFAVVPTPAGHARILRELLIGGKGSWTATTRYANAYSPSVRGDFDVLQDRLRLFASRRDWERFHTPRNLALALTGELGELAELFQWRSDQEISEDLLREEKKDAIADEIADVAIYLIRLADVCGVDLYAAITNKIDRNELRFPNR